MLHCLVSRSFSFYLSKNTFFRLKFQDSYLKQNVISIFSCNLSQDPNVAKYSLCQPSQQPTLQILFIVYDHRLSMALLRREAINIASSKNYLEKFRDPHKDRIKTCKTTHRLFVIGPRPGWCQCVRGWLLAIRKIIWNKEITIERGLESAELTMDPRGLQLHTSRHTKN